MNLSPFKSAYRLIWQKLEGFKSSTWDVKTPMAAFKWISVKNRLPKISYLESDDPDEPYESYPVLLFSPEKPGIYCVGYLVKEQDQNKWDFEKLSWEIYIPGSGGTIVDTYLETYTHWMPLPEKPKDE